MAEEFRKINCQGIRLVLLWIPTGMESLTLALKKIKILEISWPQCLIPCALMAQDSGMLEKDKAFLFRGVIVTDIHWQVTTNILPGSRSANESLFFVQILQFTNKARWAWLRRNPTVTPSSWRPRNRSIAAGRWLKMASLQPVCKGDGRTGLLQA